MTKYVDVAAVTPGVDVLLPCLCECILVKPRFCNCSKSVFFFNIPFKNWWVE